MHLGSWGAIIKLPHAGNTTQANAHRPILLYTMAMPQTQFKFLLCSISCCTLPRSPYFWQTLLQVISEHLTLAGSWKWDHQLQHFITLHILQYRTLRYLTHKKKKIFSKEPWRESSKRFFFLFFFFAGLGSHLTYSFFHWPNHKKIMQICVFSDTFFYMLWKLLNERIKQVFI